MLVSGVHVCRARAWMGPNALRPMQRLRLSFVPVLEPPRNTPTSLPKGKKPAKDRSCRNGTATLTLPWTCAVTGCLIGGHAVLDRMSEGGEAPNDPPLWCLAEARTYSQNTMRERLFVSTSRCAPTWMASIQTGTHSRHGAPTCHASPPPGLYLCERFHGAQGRSSLRLCQRRWHHGRRWRAGHRHCAPPG